MTTTHRKYIVLPMNTSWLTLCSEKARIPAWCDRILYRGPSLKQYSYNSAPIRFSDHRPVYASFRCSVLYVDDSRMESLQRAIYMRKRSPKRTDSTRHVNSIPRGKTEGVLVDLTDATPSEDQCQS